MSAVERDEKLEARREQPWRAIVFLVPHQACAERLQATLADRFESDDIRVELTTAPAAEAVTAARQQRGGTPLGVVVDDEVESLEALTAGADEVLIWPPRDDAAIQGFFDRVKLRATLRRGQERASAALLHAERLTSLGTLVAGIAHEINNPLTALQLGIEASAPLLAKQSADDGARPQESSKLLEDMLSAIGAIANIVRDLRIFARSDAGREEAQLLDVSEVIDQALRLVGREIKLLARIERDYARDLPRVLVPHGRLTQVLVNVLANAAQALREVERPAHRVRIATRTDGEGIAISISDTGPGISPHVVEHIFDPFFTTKRAGHGTGLGLSISRSIMHDLGGDLIVESVHGSGATFVLLLPIPAPSSVRQATLRPRLPASASSRSAPKRLVLVVEDDDQLSNAYARTLGRSWEVLSASNGTEAIELISSGSQPDALLSELALPEGDGQALLEWLERERPELARRTLFVSSETTQQQYEGFLSKLSNRVLTKPVSTATLLAALDCVAEPGSDC